MKSVIPISLRNKSTINGKENVRELSSCILQSVHRIYSLLSCFSLFLLFALILLINSETMNEDVQLEKKILY